MTHSTFINATCISKSLRQQLCKQPQLHCVESHDLIASCISILQGNHVRGETGGVCHWAAFCIFTHSLSHQQATNSLLCCSPPKLLPHTHYTPERMSSCYKEPNPINQVGAKNRRRKCATFLLRPLTMDTEKCRQQTGPWPTSDHCQMGWVVDPWSVLEDPTLPAALLLPKSPGGGQS